MSSDPMTERQINRRDSPALYDAMEARYVAPVAGFDELATTYDQRLAGNPVLALESVAVLGALPPIVGKTVADLGCGTGRYALQLAHLGAASVLGVDFSGEMLAVARRKARRSEVDAVTTWHQADIQALLPLADGSVDALVCGLTLSFLPSVRAVFTEAARALSPGGVFVVSDYHSHGLTQARADAARQPGSKDKAPYLRFTSAGGEDYRIAQYVHPVSDWFGAAQAAGLKMDLLSEPAADASITNTYANLHHQSGVPLAVIARFSKP